MELREWFARDGSIWDGTLKCINNSPPGLPLGWLVIWNPLFWYTLLCTSCSHWPFFSFSLLLEQFTFWVCLAGVDHNYKGAFTPAGFSLFKSNLSLFSLLVGVILSRVNTVIALESPEKRWSRSTSSSDLWCSPLGENTYQTKIGPNVINCMIWGFWVVCRFLSVKRLQGSKLLHWFRPKQTH